MWLKQEDRMYVVVLDEEIDHGLWILQCPLIARLKKHENSGKGNQETVEDTSECVTHCDWSSGSGAKSGKELSKLDIEMRSTRYHLLLCWNRRRFLRRVLDICGQGNLPGTKLRPLEGGEESTCYIVIYCMWEAVLGTIADGLMLIKIMMIIYDILLLWNNNYLLLPLESTVCCGWKFNGVF